MATAEDQLAALVDVYKATELKVLGRVSDSLSSGQDAPDWEVQKLLELERVKRLVTGDTTSAAVAGGSVARMLNDAFGSGRETDKIPAARQLKSDLIYAKVSTKVTQNAGLQQLVQQATTAAKPNTQLILRQVDDVYRQAVQRAGGGLLLGADTRKQAVQQVLNDFASQGVTGFVDKAGRKWSLPTYANMAVGTAMHRANIEGHLDKLREMGENLVVVSDHAGECPLCRPWEGKVLAIEHDGEHPTIDQARGAGLEHPGCRHRYGLWMEGISQPPIPQGSPEEYALKQRQNEIQRHVDEWQRRAAVGDPAAADKLKYWKSQLKAQKSLVSDAAAQSRETFNNLQATRTAATKAAADKAAQAAKAAATATARTTATVAKKVTTDAGLMSTGPVGSGLTNAEMKKLKAFHIEDMDDYMREGTNPNLGSGPGYMANCSNCVTAYELRSRGVWATALPRDRGRYRWETAKAWLAPDGNPPVILDVENAGAATMTAVEQALADMPDGARGAISCKWKTGGGHIWNWVKENGTVRFVDTQAYVRTENYLADSKGAIHIMRLDDAEFVGNVSDWVEPQ